MSGETELTLEQATEDLEKVRELLHGQMMAWRRAKWSWLMIKDTNVYKAYAVIRGA